MPETRPPIEVHDRSLADIAQAVADRRRPPVQSWNPVHCGHSGMRIDREGRWWHEGRQIEREALVRLFASVLRREADGRHVLVTPVEKLDIDVEFAALRVIAMTREGTGPEQRVACQINDGDAVILGPAHPLCMKDALPVVDVRAGLQASFTRPVYHELAELALGCDPPGIWSEGQFFPMGEE